jgi:hypothetical protein
MRAIMAGNVLIQQHIHHNTILVGQLLCHKAVPLLENDGDNIVAVGFIGSA